jgi:hypothetical protein
MVLIHKHITEEDNTKIRLYRGALDTERMVNGDFETDVTTGWTVSGDYLTITQSSTYAHKGTYSAKLYGTEGGPIEFGYWTTTDYMTVNGSQGRLSFWVYSVSWGYIMTYEIEWYDSSSVLVGTPDTHFFPSFTGQWNYVEITEDKPATAVKAKVQIINSSQTPYATSEHYIDDMRFYDVDSSIGQIDLIKYDVDDSTEIALLADVITIKSGGYLVLEETSSGTDGYLRWRSGSTELGRINFYYDSGGPSMAAMIFTIDSGISETNELFRFYGAKDMILEDNAQFTSTGHIVAGQGLYVGNTSGVAETDNVLVDGDVKVQSGLVVGSTAVSPGDGDAYIAGGLRVGDTNVPTADDIRAVADIAAGGGIYAGGVGGEPATGEITATVRMWINDSLNAYMTKGLTINQGVSDDEIFAVKSSDVAHAATNVTEADTYGLLKKASAASGGLDLWGVTEQYVGLNLKGLADLDVTTKSSTANAAIQAIAFKESLGNTGAMGSNANLFAVRNAGNTRMILDAEGELHLDSDSTGTAGSPSIYDDYDDIALIQGLRASMMPPGHELRERFSEFITYARPILEATGVMTYNDGPGEDGSIFMGLRGMHILTIDAMRQFYDKQMTINAELASQLEQYKQAMLAAGIEIPSLQ